MLDLRTNIMIGFNSALIVFFASSFKADWANSLFLIPALLTVALSMLLALMALKPSHYVTKKGQSESLFYHHQISSMTEEEYGSKIRESLADEDKIYDSYIKETYNLTKYSNVPRKFYLNNSIRILLYGMFISLLLFSLSYIPELLLNYGIVLF